MIDFKALAAPFPPAEESKKAATDYFDPILISIVKKIKDFGAWAKAQVA